MQHLGNKIIMPIEDNILEKCFGHYHNLWMEKYFSVTEILEDINIPVLQVYYWSRQWNEFGLDMIL